MRALLVGDIHLNDRPPSLRTESYTDDILAKLKSTVAAAHLLYGNGALDCVVWAGDVFHTKAPHRTSHSLVQRVLEIGSEYPVPWLIVPGNHDMQHDRLDSLDTQPLGTLFKAGAAVPLVGGHPDLPIFGIPFLQDWTDLKDYLADFRKFSSFSTGEGGDGYLVVTHAPIMPPGITVPYEYIEAEEWATLQSWGACYYGHIHERHGSYMAGSVIFCNQGALSRGSLHESDLRRDPAITYYDSEQLYQTKFKKVPIPHRPITEVMKLTEHEEGEAKTERLDEFLDRIGSTTLEALSIEGVLEHLRTLELKPQTETIVRECLETALAK